MYKRQAFDSIYGGLGNDTLYGGVGFDVMSGEDGNDLLDLGTDSDGGYVYGGVDDDTILGSQGADYLVDSDDIASNDNDSIDARGGNDHIYSYSGSDTPVSYTHLDVYKRQVPPNEFLSDPDTESEDEMSLADLMGRLYP